MEEDALAVCCSCVGLRRGDVVNDSPSVLASRHFTVRHAAAEAAVEPILSQVIVHKDHQVAHHTAAEAAMDSIVSIRLTSVRTIRRSFMCRLTVSYIRGDQHPPSLSKILTCLVSAQTLVQDFGAGAK